MKRVILVLMVLLAVLAVFSGCQKKETASAAAVVDYGARTTGPNYWWVKFDQPVTIHTVNMENTAITFVPGDDVTRNEYTRAFKEHLNVDVVTDWVSASNGYDEKMSLAIASNELPDVFQVNATQFRQLVEAGLVADLTDYIENNTSDMVKTMMAVAPIVTETAKVNGRLMAMPQYGYGDLWNINDLWVRHDWLEASGLSGPKTIEDLERIMDAFMRAHPGSYGFGMRRTINEFYHFASAYGALYNIWIEGPDGSLVYGTIQPEMKGALEKFADWYRRGYLKKDFTSMTDREIVMDIAANRVGITSGANWFGWTFEDVVKAQGMNAYLEPYEIPSGTGKPNVYPLPIDNYGYIVVNKNFKNIPAVLKCLSYTTWVIMESTLQGALTEEQMYRYFVSGEPRYMGMFALTDPYGNGPALVEWTHEVGLNNYQITRQPMSTEWLGQYEQAAPWWRDNSVEGYGRWIQAFSPRSSAWSNLQVINEGRFVTTRMTGPIPEDVTAYFSTLRDFLTEEFVKIIVGLQPVSYFDTIVTQWKASGGDIVTRAVNRDYGKK
jgi:putative aldouronate transport system substrate-binding protein